VGCYGERGSASPKLGSGGRAPSGSPGAEPLGMSGGRSSPEAGGILVLEHTFFCAVLELVVVADLTDRGVHLYCCISNVTDLIQ